MFARCSSLASFCIALLSWILMARDASATAASQPPAQPAPAQQDAGAWPKTVKAKGITFEVFQPQPSSWDGYKLVAAAAVKAQEGGDKPPTFGSIEIEAKTIVNKDARTVSLEQVAVTKAKFPSLKEEGAGQYLKILHQAVLDAPSSVRTLSLDRLESTIEVATAQTRTPQALKNDPPRVVFASTPTVLIYIDGTPVWQPVPNTSLARVINTRPLLLRNSQGTLFLKIFDGWLEAPQLDGSWSVTLHPAPDLEKALKAALESKSVDPLTGTTPNDTKSKPPTLKVNPPRILVATTPTELIVTDGAPKYVPMPPTELLYIENTTGNVFKHTGDQQTYLLISGRWFKAPSENGPWTFVASDQLPKDFASIPDESPKENVKASVAGTPQSQEALIANNIPQTAKVDRKAKFTPKLDGEPKLESIEGTTPTLYRVVNCATPILKVSDTQFFAVENGVWFSAKALTGPWVVADTIPAVIYSIPPSSPVYYVTYVKVYEATPTTVVVGYTPGYYGAYVSGTTVVYGTGYYYPPYVSTTVWYGPPVTYGCGVGIAYTPWTGWAFAFGFGMAWGSAMAYGGWHYGPYPWWGPVGVGFYSPAYYPWRYGPAGGAVWGPRPGSGAVWGPGGWAASTGNVYQRWGSTAAVTRSSAGYNAWTGNRWSQDVGRSYNSRTGTLAAGQRSSVGNVYSGEYQTNRSGAAVHQRSGSAAVGASTTRGNAYTGQQVTAGRAAVRNPNTGEVTTAAGVRGDNGSVARVGDDLYVSHDGNVARRGADGAWQERSGSEWKDVDRNASSRGELDRSYERRSQGEARSQGFNNGAHRAAGFGGGVRGGGGRRR